MKPVVIAVMVHKGGTGKTTSVAGLADAFSQLNKKVLIIDADEQSNIKTVFGIKLQDSEGGLASVLISNVNPEKLTLKVRDNVDVILSGGRVMREFERMHANTPDAELLLKKRLQDLDGYDVVLIDCPPALSLISTNIVTYADYLVIPCSPDLLSVVGVKNTINFVESLSLHFKNQNISLAKPLAVLPTMLDGRRNLDMSIYDDLQRLEDANLLAGARVIQPIRSDIKVKTAQVKRKLLSETFPNANATVDYARAGKEILELIDQKTVFKKNISTKTKTVPAEAGL